MNSVSLHNTTFPEETKFLEYNKVNIRYYHEKIGKSRANSLEEKDVIEIIIFLQNLLNIKKEIEGNGDSLVDYMYQLSNKCYELYKNELVFSIRNSKIEKDVQDDGNLFNTINLDIEAEQAEEGHGIEGNVKYYFGKRYERDAKNRRLAIKKHGLNCYTCGFNFEEVYGERGKDFIEVHHIKPLSTLEEAVEINPDTDLVPLCANCHRMVHRRKDDVLSIEELKEIIRKYSN